MKRLLALTLVIIACVMLSACGYRLAFVPTDSNIEPAPEAAMEAPISEAPAAEAPAPEATPTPTLPLEAAPDPSPTPEAPVQEQTYFYLRAPDSSEAVALGGTTVQITADNFLEYFSLHTTYSYDIWDERTYNGWVVLRSINPSYQGYLPVLSEGFAAELEIERPDYTVKEVDGEYIREYKDKTIKDDMLFSGIALYSGPEGEVTVTEVKRTKGSVTFLPLEICSFSNLESLETDSPRAAVTIHSGKTKTFEFWPNGIDMRYLLESNNLK